MKQLIEEERRFALLLACKDSDYAKKAYGGYLNVFVQAFGDEGEKWDLFRVVEGEFPNMEDLDRYDGFVVSGSPHDAYSNDEWILELCFLLQTLDVMQKKVLGVCFGHQVMCRALGGRVGKAGRGWYLGIRKVFMVEGLQHFGFLEYVDDFPSSAYITECHQDEVWELPIGAQVIAYSDQTLVEAFTIGEHMMGIQGHPEYAKDILCDIIGRLVDNNSINCDFADKVRAVTEGAEPDRGFWQTLCKGFLKRKYH